MTTDIIKIAGKEVNIAYCYATEITFTKYSGTPLDNLDANNPEHLLYLILSGIMSYYISKGLEPPIKDEDLMYNAEAQEIIDALNAIMKLKVEWYKLPTGEPTEEVKEEDAKKNA